jgi:hypothetical protein
MRGAQRILRAPSGTFDRQDHDHRYPPLLLPLPDCLLQSPIVAYEIDS